MRSRAVVRRVVLALLIGGAGLPDVLVARPSVQPPPAPEAAAAVIETVEQPELYSSSFSAAELGGPWGRSVVGSGAAS